MAASSASPPPRPRDDGCGLIDSYETRRGREAMLRFGPARGPVALVVLPLFEEANRVRAFAVAICRALAVRGVGSLLPDVPGQGESLVPLETCGLTDLTEAIALAASCAAVDHRCCYGVALRSGALLDTAADLLGRWHLAPQDGASLVRELKRIRHAGDRRPAAPDDSWIPDSETPLEIAGNLLSATLLTELARHEPRTATAGERLRTVRLDTDAMPADRHVLGAPLWRRAEPDTDATLAKLLADDIADWIARCEA